MADPYKFSFDVAAFLEEQEAADTSVAPKEGVMKKPEAPVEEAPMSNTDRLKKRFADTLSSFYSGTQEIRDKYNTAQETNPLFGRDAAQNDWIKALEVPPVTTTDMGPDMGTLAMQDAQEQSAIRSVSGITESLGRPQPTAMTDVAGLTAMLEGEADAGVTLPSTDSVSDMYPTQGLMSPPVQDTVSEIDTSVPIPAEEVEEVTPVADTAATTPTRDELIDSVFDAEGGYSTDRDDTGNYYRGQFVGTNHGISAPVLAEHLGRTPTVEDMRGLTQDTAREIAATQYYDTYNISDLPDETQEIVFHAVYMGGSRGVRAVQNLTGSTPDGVMGPNTRTAMQESTFTPQEFRDEYLRELEFGTTGYSSPAATWDVHGTGWSNRYNDLAGE